MKTNILIGLAVLTAGAVIAAEPSSKDTLTAAAKKLGDQPNYTWRTTVGVPQDAQFRPGPTDGKTEKGGYTLITMSFFDNPIQIARKGDKVVYTDQDGNWQTLTEGESGEGPGQFMAMMVRNLKNPAEEAAELASYAKELKKDGDAYVSDLTDEGAKKMQTFAGGVGPTVSNAKGSVKFWLKDGALTKYEFKLKGTLNFNGNDFDNDRTTTVEIKDVGTTKLNVPEAATKKLL